MKQKTLFYIILFLITLSFLISTIISVRTINEVVKQEDQDKANLLAYNIYRDIDSELYDYVVMSRALANNQELIDVLVDEDNYDSNQIKDIFMRMLGRYVESMGCDTAFVVTKNMNYYTENGFNKVVAPLTDAHDVWYTDFLAKNTEYELNLDVDEVNNGTWTVFVNVRVLDEKGELVGVCGVGTIMQDVQNALIDMQESYDIDISIWDSNGALQMSSNNQDIQYYQSAFDLDGVLDTDGEIRYTGNASGYTITKYMDDLDWTLVIHHANNNMAILYRLIAKNLLFMFVVFAVFLLGATYIIRRGSINLEKNVALNSYGTLAGVYKGMYIMDFRTNSVKEIKNMLSDNETHMFEEDKPLDAQLEVAIENWVFPEFQDMMAEFLDLSTVEERIGDKESISEEFKAHIIGWGRARFIAVRKEDGVIDYLIFAVEVIDEERHKQEVLQQETNEAKAASDAKGRFLANMSHEIRTPINSVLGMDTMILRETNEPKIKEYAMHIQNAGQTLLSLINDILDFSKIESGKMEIIPTKYDLSSLINDVVNMMNERAQAKSLDFILDVDNALPSELYGDDVRIRQVIVNLLSNAIKYTPEGSVTFSIQGDVTEDEIMLHFSIKDTGIGIKEEDMGRLFGDFERIHDAKNHYVEGTGLGMSITVQLLALMNSKLNVNSVYGEGSEFAFDLKQLVVNPEPIGDITTRVMQQAQDYEYEVSFIAPDAKVLVVDDNSMNRVVFTSLLKETEVMIEEASGGVEALEKILNNAYDLIFLDHMMPDMDGIEVLHNIHCLEDHPNVNTPVIVLTANAISGAKEKYIKEGFEDYLSKPIIPERLEKIIAQYLPDEKKQPVALHSIRQILENDAINVDEWPAIQGIDWNYAALHLNKKDILKKSITSFCQSIPYEANELEHLYDRVLVDDEEAMGLFRIKVHSMKSSANLLGIIPLGGTAAMLEYAAREQDKNLVMQVTPHFLATWRSYQELLQQAFGVDEDKQKKDISDRSEIVDYLRLLKETTSRFDVHGADAALEHLRQFEYSQELQVMLDRITGAVNNLDTENVEKWVEEMIELIQRSE